MKDLPPAPEPTAVDYFAGIVKAAVSGIPGWGSPAAELFGMITAPILGRRRDQWLEDLRILLNDVGQQIAGLTPDALANNEAFISAFVQATQAAIKTHQTEKLEALKNAVVNVTLGHEPDADRQQQFLAFVDRFSSTHLVLLRFFNDPATYFQKAGRPVPMVPFSTPERVQKLLVYQLVTNAMPFLSEQLKSPLPERTAAFFQFVESVLGDLVFAKLIALDRLNDTWSVPKFDPKPKPTPVKPLITHLGADFLAFITEPSETTTKTDPRAEE